MGMILKYRDQGQMIILNAAGEEEVYEILHLFPFSSDTKRMGIMVKHKVSGKLVFYLKGADVIMK
jgi:phospholipid-translocating ATPase